MIENLQCASRDLLIERNLRPADHPIWGGPGWKVYLDSTDDFHRTVKYIEQNPIKAGWPAQEFDFVTPYDNWPNHRR
jgi:hypothetical protein